MEPVTLAIGITEILSLLTTLIQYARKYHKGVKGAETSISLFVAALETLELTLRRLDAFLTNERGGAARLQIHQNSVLLTCSSACKIKLQELKSKIENARRNRFSHLRWPLDEGENKKTIQELGTFACWIQMALSTEGIQLLSESSDKMTEIISQQLNSFRAVLSVQSAVARIEAAVEGHTDLVATDRDDADKTKILDWISTFRHDQRHQTVRAARVEDTGNWFLRCPDYLEWCDTSSSSNVLWCYGNPGTGKTVLA